MYISYLIRSGLVGLANGCSIPYKCELLPPELNMLDTFLPTSRLPCSRMRQMVNMLTPHAHESL